MASNLEKLSGRDLRRGISTSDAEAYERRYGKNGLGSGIGLGINDPSKVRNLDQEKSDQASIDKVANIVRATQAGGPDRGDSIFASQEDVARYASEDAEQKLKDQQAKTQANADRLSSQAQDFRKDLPNYINRQTTALGDSSRMNLAKDIQKVKQNSNARGLLYSGVNEGNIAEAKGYESDALAKDVQGVNMQANSQADFRDQLAANAQTGAEGQDVALSQFQATQTQTAYEQALQKQASQNAFWGGLFGTVGQIGGLIASGGLSGAAKVAKV